jgi:hypothetical protein
MLKVLCQCATATHKRKYLEFNPCFQRQPMKVVQCKSKFRVTNSKFRDKLVEISS